MPSSMPPTRRSRNGCIDCRRAKVKCDEIRPSCGTCARRKHICRGYANPPPGSTRNSPPPRSSSSVAGGAARSSSNFSSTATASAAVADDAAHASMTPTPTDTSTPLTAATPGTPATPPDLQMVSQTKVGYNENQATAMMATPARRRRRQRQASNATTAGKATPTTVAELSPLGSFFGCLSLIPRSAVSPADEANIETYFKRHPFELVIGEEFVSEMNANVLVMLQHDPIPIADGLSAIGYAYSARGSTGSLMPVLNRRARILANLRNMPPSGQYFEEALFLLLVLCAIELITLAQPGSQVTIPTVLSNASSLIDHHLSSNTKVSSIGRYHLRALARQDMVVSLIQLRRPLVPTYVWLDYQESTKADRLLGYTATLMPLLEELCILADEVRDQVLAGSALSRNASAELAAADNSLSAGTKGGTAGYPDVLSSPCAGLDCLHLWLNTAPSPPIVSGLHLRAESLRQRLISWHPAIVNNLPFRSTRKFHAQVAAYRAGALLYLHRLQHPPLPPWASRSASCVFSAFPLTPPATETASTLGSPAFVSSSSEADAEALSEAHDILMYASGLQPTELKLLLWPVFLAACELQGEEDRAAVLELFASIAASRQTVTVERTRSFVQDRVWRARDDGLEWNWMALAQKYPGECLPI